MRILALLFLSSALVFGQASPNGIPNQTIGTASTNSATGQYMPGAFTASGTGGSARSPQAKLADIVSILDYGGAQDGTTDNSTPLNNAVAHLPSTGGTVTFPCVSASNYLFTSAPTQFTKPILLKGDVGGCSVVTESFTSGKWFDWDPGVTFTRGFGINQLKIVCTASSNTVVGLQVGDTSGAEGWSGNESHVLQCGNGSGGAGIKFGSNTWNINLGHTHFIDNKPNITGTASWTNSGENMTIIGGAFDASTGYNTNCAILNAAAEPWNFISSTFAGCQIVVTTNANLIGVHFEPPNGTLNATDMVIVHAGGALSITDPSFYFTMTSINEAVLVDGGTVTMSGGQATSTTSNFPSLITATSPGKAAYLGGTQVTNINSIVNPTSTGHYWSATDFNFEPNQILQGTTPSVSLFDLAQTAPAGLFYFTDTSDAFSLYGRNGANTGWDQIWTFTRAANGNNIGTIDGAMVMNANGTADGIQVNQANSSGWAGNFTGGKGVQSSLYATFANCSSSASPAVCGAAAAGSFVIAAAATTVTVNTTAVTANSQIFIQPDTTLGTKLTVTCNTATTVPNYEAKVSARTAGTSFQVTATGAFTTNPGCFSYFIVN